IDFSLDSKDENQELSISKFENMSELFYKAAENEILENESIIEYHDLFLTNDETKELNTTIKLKVEELLSKRDICDTKRKYDVNIVVIPLNEEEFNLGYSL
ncbi:MAG: ArsR family transcriptional regulator, partial [Peptostreptococcaceae bacterium]